MAGTYMFRDAQHKKDCLIQSMQLTRQVFTKNPPKNQRENLDSLLYLGLVYLIENAVTKNIDANHLKDKQWQKIGIDMDEARSFQKTRAKLRKTAEKFIDDPTRTTLWLSV